MAIRSTRIGGHPLRHSRKLAALGSAVAGFVMLVMAAAAAAGPTDIVYPPTTSAGHDLNHSPIGQSFRAIAPSVTAGIHIADGVTFTSWLATIYPGQIAPGSYPYTPAPTLSLTVSLYEGEGLSGSLLHTTSLAVAAPFMGFLDVDYAAAGVLLVPGNMYTIVVADDRSFSSYPYGVSGWIVSSVTDPDAGQPVTDDSGNVVGYLPYGAYYEGHPILQGTLYSDDAGIGDNAFHVIDTALAEPDPLTIVTTALPNGRVGATYAAAIEWTGGHAPVTIAVTGLPAGLVFDGLQITGSPAVAGAFTLAVTATDSLGASATATLALTVDPDTSSYTIKDEGKGRITAVGPGYIKVRTKTIKYDSRTTLKLNYAAEIKVGMTAQWKGFRDRRTGIVLATQLEIN